MYTRRAIILPFILAFFTVVIDAQDVDLDNFSGNMDAKKGPNAQSFGHFLTGFGLIADQPEADREIKYLASNTIDIGYRYKYKMGNIFSAGWELGYTRLKFSYDPVESALLDMFETPEKEFLRLHQLMPGIYFRINFDPDRGNAMGKYIDLGGYGAFNFGRNYYLEYEGDDDFKSQKVIYNGLDDVEKLSYGLVARLGINKFVLFSRYRVSDLVKTDDFALPEPSRIVVGIQMGIHK